MLSTVKPMRKVRQDLSTDNPTLERLTRTSVNLRQIMDSWNDFFCEYSEQEKSIVYTFVQYKSFELHDKFKLYQKIF